MAGSRRAGCGACWLRSAGCSPRSWGCSRCSLARKRSGYRCSIRPRRCSIRAPPRISDSLPPPAAARVRWASTSPSRAPLPIGRATAAGRRRWGVALASIAVCTAALIGAVRTVILPAIGEGYTRRPFALALRRAVSDASQVHTGSSLDYGTLFYWDAAMPGYDRERDAEPPQYLLVPESAWLQMSAAERRHFRRIAGLRVPRANNQGYVAVLERTAPPAAPVEQSWPA